MNLEGPAIMRLGIRVRFQLGQGKWHAFITFINISISFLFKGARLINNGAAQF